MDKIDLAIYLRGIRAETAKAVSAVAHHGVMDKIEWTNLQCDSSAEVEHAEILIAIVGDDYRDGMTPMKVRRAIADGEADIGDYSVMFREYIRIADRIAAALAPYADKAVAGDAAARHVLASMRKRHVWVRICKEADAYPAARLDDALDILYSEGEREIAFTH